MTFVAGGIRHTGSGKEVLFRFVCMANRAFHFNLIMAVRGGTGQENRFVSAALEDVGQPSANDAGHRQPEDYVLRLYEPKDHAGCL